MYLYVDVIKEIGRKIKFLNDFVCLVVKICKICCESFM